MADIRESLISLRDFILSILFIRKRREEFEQLREEEERKEEYMRKINYPNNNKEFPFNIYEPEEVLVGNERYVRYKAVFRSLHDLYEYLSSNPRVNDEVFSRLHSLTNGEEWAGLPYEEALESLESPPRGEYRNFLTLSEKLDEAAAEYVREYIDVRSPGGGYVDVPSYVTGNPLCFKTSRSVYVPKFIRVNIALSYYHGTTKKQVLHRALIVAALVNAFERAGYIVEINTFELSKYSSEFIDIDVNIKNNSETFNKASLYKTLCYVEFLRRLLFRVLETLDVTEDWEDGYGHTCSEEFVRKARRMDENEIFIDQPREMGIEGESIGKDFERVLAHLRIEDKIDVKRAKREFNKDVKKLEKTIK